MNRFLERLKSGATLIADGATGTNLYEMGLKLGTPPEALVLEQPELISRLAAAFVAAGADILLTCTFGGTRLRMKDSKYAERAPEINRRAVELARQAAAVRPEVLVAGSLGPTGQLMQPFGPLTPEEATGAYLEQAEALAEGGADLLVIETHFSIDEATAAFRGALAAAKLPIVVSFSYDRGVRTMMGVKPTEVIKHFKVLGAAMVGANCGTSLENMEKVVQEYATAEPGFPLWVKPNAGLPRNVDGAAVYDVTPRQMAEFALKYIALGARVVGGCCGSTPEHIAAIAREVRPHP